MLLASAGEDEAMAIAGLLSEAARRRLDLEARQSKAFVAEASDKAAAEAGERVLLDAWVAWYTRALESVLALPASTKGDRLERHVRAAISGLQGGGK
jgi:hypothetical protein